jgi:dihydrofolate reductase
MLGDLMPETVYYVAASVDGFIATPDGGLDWLGPFESSGEDYGYWDFYASIDAVVMGSRTYEQALGFPEWPYPDKPVRVASRRVLPAAGTNVVVTDCEPATLLGELAEKRAKRVWLVGGGALAGSFAAAGLIDEYIISTIPVLLGTGVPLLGGCAASNTLRLVDSTTYPDGVMQVVYRPVR